ncbi:MAG: hypothetical protein QM778_27805 [Myxococcales bacterium]
MATLKPQDLLVLLKLAAVGKAPWSYASLAKSLYMSPSEVHAALGRAAHSGLYNRSERRPIRAALEEFVLHGARYAYAPVRAGVARGVPTSHAAPVLAGKIVSSSDDLAPVWADEEGSVRGESIEPLYPSAPRAAREDPKLYELLALVDALRIGRARERKLAETLLRQRLAA